MINWIGGWWGFKGASLHMESTSLKEDQAMTEDYSSIE